MEVQQKPQIAKEILRNKNKAGCITLADFKGYYKSRVIGTDIVLYNNRQIEHRNRNKNPEINPSIYGQLIFNKKSRIFNGEKRVAPMNGAGKVGYSHAKERNLTLILDHSQKLSWTKD